MLVQQILKSKASDAVITVAPEASIADLASLLSRHRIGAAVVSSDGRHPLGIVSERDVVRALDRAGAGCLGEAVSKIMTRELQTCQRGETAVAVLERMTAGRFRHLPVVEHGKLVGLISIGDLVKARLSELDMEKEALTGMIMGN